MIKNKGIARFTIQIVMNKPHHNLNYSVWIQDNSNNLQDFNEFESIAVVGTTQQS